MSPSPPPSQAAPSSSSSSPPSINETELDRLGSELNKCLLNQYVFTVVGIGLGTGVGIYRKSLLPLVAFGAAGSIGDLLFGLSKACHAQFDAYKQCRMALNPPPVLPPPPPGLPPKK